MPRRAAAPVCPPGFVATTHGAGNTTCAKCDAGKYSDTPDASTCQACALPYVVNEDQTGCACSTNWVMRLGTCGERVQGRSSVLCSTPPPCTRAPRLAGAPA